MPLINKTEKPPVPAKEPVVNASSETLADPKDLELEEIPGLEEPRVESPSPESPESGDPDSTESHAVQGKNRSTDYVLEEGDSRDPKKWGRRTSDKLGPILEQIVGVLSSDSIFESFANLAEDIRGIVDCEVVRIYSIDREKKELVSKSTRGSDTNEIRWPISQTNLPGYVVGSGKPVLLTSGGPEELKKFPGLHADALNDKFNKRPLHSAIVVPLVHQNKLIGAFEFLNRNDHQPFDQQESDLVREAAPKMAQLLAKLHQEETEERIKSIAISIHKSMVMQEVLSEIKEPLLKIFDCEMITLYQVNASDNELFPMFCHPGDLGHVTLPINHESIAGWVAQERNIINLPDVYEEAHLRKVHQKLKFNRQLDESSGRRTRSTLACPLINDGALLGVFQVFNKFGGGAGFDKDDEKNMVTIVELLSIALANQKKISDQKPSKYSWLVMNGIISPTELNEAIVKSRSMKIWVEDVLLDVMKLKREDIGKSLSHYYKVPYVGYDPNTLLPKECFAGLNKNWLVKNHIVPIEKHGTKMVILTNDPSNHDNLKHIQNIFRKKEVVLKVGLRADIQDFLKFTSMGGNDPTQKQAPAEEEEDDSPLMTEEVSSLLSALQEESGETVVESGHDDDDGTSAISDSDSTIVRLVNKIIIDAYDQGVSDIHVEPGIGKNNVMVRFRKDGECDLYQEIPWQYKRALVSRFKIISKLDIAEKRLPQDGKIKMKYGRKEIELRTATLPTVGGNEDIVLRILAASEPIPLEKMNFNERNLDLLKAQVVKPYGLILVVGPTGSGKTTTLHSCLAYINTPKRKIWTAEDPVEITQFGLRQVQMHSRIGLDFARAMRAFLRGDPDVIMVGEMRDMETCAIGLEASLTGHLVFSTLHTNSAPETITRLLDMGMNPINFADALLLIVAQRLVKTLCKSCKEEFNPSQEEYDNIVEEYDPELFKEIIGVDYSEELKWKRGMGCNRCGDSGYSGRTGLHELLEGTPEMKRLIMKKALVEDLRAAAISQGMTTLKQDGIYKVFKGDCDLKQVLAVCIA